MDRITLLLPESIKAITGNQWIWLSLLTTLTYAAVRCIYLLFIHPASKFPGPKLAAVSNVWYAYHWFMGRWPWKMEQMIRKYGNVVRIAPNELVFWTPEATNGKY
ncbi:hypothetical protein Hte_000284 [Hypoxylon texense]